MTTIIMKTIYVKKISISSYYHGTALIIHLRWLAPCMYAFLPYCILEVVAVGVHHLGPRGNKVLDELFLGVAARVYLGNAT